MAHLTIPAGEPLVSYTPGASSTRPLQRNVPDLLDQRPERHGQWRAAVVERLGVHAD
jgi:hypothetical protein